MNIDGEPTRNSKTLNGETSLGDSTADDLVISGDLSVAGTSSFEGQLNMNNAKIINLGTPTSSGDATNKAYVDGSIPVVTGFLKLDGTNSMGADLNVGSNKIKNVTSGAASGDAVNLSQLTSVITSVNTNTANISTNTAAISTANTNISNNAAAISTNTSAISTNTAAIATANTNIANNTSAISTNTSNISANTSAIDTLVGVTSTNTSNISNNATAISTANTNISNNTTAIAGCLKLDGSNAMTASLDAGTNKLVNVTDPTAAQDGATKAYVDSKSSPWTVTTDGGSGAPQLQYSDGSIKVDGQAVMGSVQLNQTASFGHTDVYENQNTNMALEQIAGGSTFIKCGITTDGVHQFIRFYGNNNAHQMTIRGDGGGVGIGTLTPTFPLEVSGFKVNGGAFRWMFFLNVSQSGGYIRPLSGATSTGGAHNQNRMSVSASHGYLTNTGYLQASDDRIKSFEKPLEVGLKEILQLEPKHYLKHPTIFVDADDETGETLPVDDEGKLFQTNEDGEKEPLDCDFELGLISQAVEKIKGLEILVTEEYNGIKNVNYVGLIPVLVKAIQELDAKRKEDNKKFIDLNKRLLVLEDKLKNVESNSQKEYIL